jgi:hypothetical protein
MNLKPMARLMACFALCAGALMAAETPAGAYQTLGVALYNLTNDQITVTWPNYDTSNPNSGINPYQQSVAASQMLFLGQALIPTSESDQNASFLISIVDATSGVNLDFSVSAYDCQYDAYAWALSNYLAFCHNGKTQDASLMDNTSLLSYDVNGSNMRVCLKGNPESGINNSVNYNVGITDSGSPSSSAAYCYEPSSGNYVPTWFPTMDSSSTAFGMNAQYYIALGSYAPTAGPAVTTQAFSGLSPAGVSPCIGSMCNIPNDTPNWPLTIYYYGVAGSSTGSFFPGFQYNSSATPSSSSGLILWSSDPSVNAWGQGAINVPSYLSNYGNAGAEDTYRPIANGFPDISSIPMPCWPTFNLSEQAVCDGQPLFATEPPPPPTPKSSALIQIGNVNFSAALIDFYSAF